MCIKKFVCSLCAAYELNNQMFKPKKRPCTQITQKKHDLIIVKH